MESSIKGQVEEQMAVIRRGVAEIVPEEELKDKLFRAIKENRPLRIKLGLDPTAPDIHLDTPWFSQHSRLFQDLHEVHLFIGDFSGRI